MRALLLSLLAALALGAETPTPAGALTLDEMLRHMATTPGVVAEFRELKRLALLDAPIETRGTLYFAPPDRLARVTRTPAATRLLLVGDRMRFEDETGTSEVDLSANPVARQFAHNLIVLWRGDRLALESLYRLVFEADGARWTLVLSPKSAPLRDFVRSIRIAGDGAAIVDMELVETDGDSTHTLFEKSDVLHTFGAEEELAIFGPRTQP